MRLPSHHSRGPLGFNMTPMIDVVFLLIIFFLVSSHLAKQESQLELPLPIADSGSTPVESERPRVTVNVLADGGLTVAGKRIAGRELAAQLSERRRQDGADLEVRIRSDRNVPFRDIGPILTSCTQASIWNVTFAVYRSQDATRGTRGSRAP